MATDCSTTGREADPTPLPLFFFFLFLFSLFFFSFFFTEHPPGGGWRRPDGIFCPGDGDVCLLPDTDRPGVVGEDAQPSSLTRLHSPACVTHASYGFTRLFLGGT